MIYSILSHIQLPVTLGHQGGVLLHRSSRNAVFWGTPILTYAGLQLANLSRGPKASFQYQEELREQAFLFLYRLLCYFLLLLFIKVLSYFFLYMQTRVTATTTIEYDPMDLIVSRHWSCPWWDLQLSLQLLLLVRWCYQRLWMAWPRHQQHADSWYLSPCSKRKSL